MNKTALVLKHELTHTVTRTGFIIMTLIVPVLALLAIGIIHVVQGRVKAPASQAPAIGYVDEAGGFSSGDARGGIPLTRFATAAEALKAMVSGRIKQYFVIPPDYLSTGSVTFYSFHRQLAVSGEVSSAVTSFLTRSLLAGKATPQEIARIEAPLNAVARTLMPSGATAPMQGGYANFLIPAAFSLLLVLSLIFSSAYFLQGLGEEKENRLMEILLSSVSSRQLLFGKVLGLGAAGLVQVAVWVVSLPLLLRLASSSFGGVIATMQIPPGFVTLGLVYFILGYLLFAALSAGVGAISPTTRDAQQLSALYTMLAVSPLWFMSILVLFPDSTVWVVLTIFPVTAPVVVMARLGLTGVPAWQLVASISALVLCISAALFLGARIFRTFLLMYGKRPRIREIVAALRKG